MNDKQKVVKRLLDDFECKRHKSDLPCDECEKEYEAEYQSGLDEWEEAQKAKQYAEEQEENDREQEFLNRGGPYE